MTIDNAGLVQRLSLQEGAASLPGERGIGNPVLSSRELLVDHATPTHPSRVLRYNLETATATPVIESSLEVDERRLVKPESVAYESADGTEIHGLLYDSGERPSPAVVDVHGGPHTRVMRGFVPRVQYLLARGYTVLRPNYRGSTGRGEEFRTANKGDYGGIDVTDVAAGGHWLARRDWIAVDRIAVFGESWGGYNAYMQAAKHSDLWAACAGLNGATDLVAMYEEYGQPAVLEEELGGLDISEGG